MKSRIKIIQDRHLLESLSTSTTVEYRAFIKIENYRRKGGNTGIYNAAVHPVVIVVGLFPWPEDFFFVQGINC
jgi:hypothetical protein